MIQISDLIVKTLKSNGVTTVFGIPSIHNIGLYDALRRDGGIRHILCRHEGSAVHMADGYGRSGAGVGVVIASTGPGVAYTLSPLIEAFYSCSPVVVMTSNIRLNQMEKGFGVLHEFRDQAGAFKNVTKACFCLEPDDDIAETVANALSMARSGRPGPVYVEIPNDMWDLETVEDNGVYPDPRNGFKLETDMDTVVERVRQAKYPKIIAGVEAVHAGLAPEVSALAEMIHGVVLTDAGGKGIMPEDHSLCFGNAVNSGVVKEIHKTCDLTLSIGSRLRYVDFKRRGLACPGLIHMDWDDQWVDKNFTAEIKLIGDVAGILHSLKTGLCNTEIPPERETFVNRMNEKRGRLMAQTPDLYRETAYVDALRRAIPGNGRLVADNTIIAYFAEQIYPSLCPLGLVPAKGASPIGFAFPAAVGMKIAQPDCPVVALTGDGGFLYGAQELTTCVANGVGFPVIVVNDGAYRMIDYLQQNRFKAGYQTALVNPDFAAMAESFGIRAAIADSPSALHDALKRALKDGEMWLIEVNDTFPDPPFGKV